MDNFYFIGYRIDILRIKELKDYCLTDPDGDKIYDAVKKFGVDYLPGEKWIMWSHVREDIAASLLAIEVDGIEKGDYRCPIDRAELWEDLHKNSFDVPNTLLKDIKIISKDPVYKKISSMFTEEYYELRWGIFLGLG